MEGVAPMPVDEDMTPNPRPWWRLNTTLTCETGCGELLGVGAFWGLMVAVALATGAWGVAIAYVAYYLAVAVRRPTLTYTPNERNAALLRQCPRLRSFFFPCMLCFQADMSIVLYLVREFCGSSPTYRREELVMEDGGLIALDWLDPSEVVAGGGPIVMIMPGVTSDATDFATRNLARAVARRGWRAVVLVRRGNGIPLRTPRLNVFGDVRDVAAAIAHIRSQLLPHDVETQIAIAGFSAGAGVTVRYIAEQAIEGQFPPGWARRERGKDEQRGRLLCSVVLCGGYDIRISLKRVRSPCPQILAGMIADFFTGSANGDDDAKARDAMLSQADPQAVREARDANVVHGTIEALSAFAGIPPAPSPTSTPTGTATGTLRSTTEHLGIPDTPQSHWHRYLVACNPLVPYMPRPPAKAVPLLMINTGDDPIGVPENRFVIHDIIKRGGNILYAEFARGSHLCFFGFFGGASFIGDATLEFIDAALQLDRGCDEINTDASETTKLPIEEGGATTSSTTAP
jgi:pimeloyl-ACP methyl ester carboxylesterase